MSNSPMEIHRICDDFEQACTGGTPPRIEDVIAACSSADVHNLLAKLIAVDAYHRARRGQAVSLDDYRLRFPQLVEVLPKILSDARTSNSLGASVETQYALPPDRKILGAQPRNIERPGMTGFKPPERAPAPILQGQPGFHLTSIPGYELMGEIARGGMGVVYAMRDLTLNREVAVKVLLPDTITSDAAARFAIEAKITARLSHPGIPPVHELGTLSDGSPFLAMKLVRGTTFSKRLKARAPCAADRAQLVQVFDHICQAVAYAHSQRVIHRDLKPGNVMVGEFGEVQVMDWGLAKRLRPVEPNAATDSDPEATILCHLPVDGDGSTHPQGDMTRAGEVMGTPAYMPPEQASGEIDHVDERADVFALGAILCEILTGSPPYEGQSARDVWQKALEGDVSGTFERLAKCDAEPELINLATDCLAPRREDRPCDAGVVVRRLERFQTGARQRLEQAQADRVAAEVQSREERKRRRVAVGLLGSLLLLIVGIGGAGFWYQARQSESRARHTRLEEDLERTLQSAEGTLEALHTDLADPVEATNLPVNPLRWDSRLESVRAAIQRVESQRSTAERPISASLVARCELLAASLNRDEHDRKTAQRIDDYRFPQGQFIESGQLRFSPTAQLFLAEFRQAGMDLEQGTSDEIARRIESSTLRWFWVGALDYFAGNKDTTASLRARALEISRRADPNPWRDRLRDPTAWTDRAKLEALVRDPEAERQPPDVIATVARQMKEQGGNATTLLRIALIHHPQNYWLLVESGYSSVDGIEAVTCLQAAAALRPRYANTYNTLGAKQEVMQWQAEAVASYNRAIELDPSYWLAYRNRGHLWARQGRTEEAIADYKRVMELQPAEFYSPWELGELLQKQGNLSEAIALYRQMAGRWPNAAHVHQQLGLTLFETGQLDLAATSLRRAIDLFPADNPGRQSAQIQLEQCVAFDSVAPKLAAFQAGSDQPASAAEAFTIAEYCVTYRKDYASAARFYALAFDMKPVLTDREAFSRRLTAATVAARALAGEGLGEKATAEARVLLRRQVLARSKEILFTLLLDSSDTPGQRAMAISTLQTIEQGPVFRVLRDEQSISDLALEERAEWRQFWADVSHARLAIDARESAPFVIVARDGIIERRHNSLATALAAANDGDSIEIRGDGPFDQESLTVTGKSLTVRAGSESIPVLRFPGAASLKLQPGEMFWNVKGGSLTLEGLDLFVDGDTPVDKYYAILGSESNDVFAAGCRFRYGGGNPNVVAIWSIGSPRLFVKACEFTGAFAVAIGVTPPAGSRIEIENCFFAGRTSVFAVQSSSPTHCDADIVLSGNTFATDMVAQWRMYTPALNPDQPAPSGAGFRVVSRDNVFAAEITAVTVQYLELRPNIVPAPETGINLFRKICQWREERNLYSASMPLMRLDYGKAKAHHEWFEGPPETSPLAADISAWEEFWNMRETGSRTEWMAYQGGSGQALVDARRLKGPDAFLLHEELVKKLNLQGGQNPPGIKGGSVGPGEPYHRWKQTPDALQWKATR